MTVLICEHGTSVEIERQPVCAVCEVSRQNAYIAMLEGTVTAAVAAQGERIAKLEAARSPDYRDTLKTIMEPLRDVDGTEHKSKQLVIERSVLDQMVVAGARQRSTVERLEAENERLRAALDKLANHPCAAGYCTDKYCGRLDGCAVRQARAALKGKP